MPTRRRGREEGSATLEVAILGPTLLALIFITVQTGLWFYARSLAHAAAAEGVTAGRAYQAPPGAGTARAQAFIAAHAGDSLLAATVTDAGSDTSTVRIRVTGQALSVLTGIGGWTVSQSAEAPRERFTLPDQP